MNGIQALCATAGAFLLTLGAPVANALADDAKVTPLEAHDLRGVESREGLMALVEYPPGGSTASHRHNADVFVYVLEGSLVMQVEGGEPVTLGPGQTFHEAPDDVHAVSRNASGTAPAKFLVFFVKDKGAPPLIPAP